MRNWLFLIPFFAVIGLINYHNPGQQNGDGIEIHFASDDVSFATQMDKFDAPRIRLYHQEGGQVIELYNLQDVWQALPQGSLYSGGSQEGFLHQALPLREEAVSATQVNQVSQESQVSQTSQRSKGHQKALPGSLLPQLRVIRFRLPKDSCRILFGQTRTFNCDQEKGYRVAINGLPVELKHFSSGIYQGGFLGRQGQLIETGIYAVRVDIQFGDQRYDFSLYTRPDYIQAKRNMKDSETTIAAQKNLWPVTSKKNPSPQSRVARSRPSAAEHGSSSGPSIDEVKVKN